ncbi:MAG: ABC transporter ATP-binding protein [Proteobacteria bacterium]|nr:ABC transporter ATP-binding protein [Pseudomonadota bacterium]MBU1388015.1 ABC transporter ATP-binding protein [Pseudomonadota bacterium]MBU2482862.1 ABC transporter ATP-binding protein [Pseudomonadota bacterium]
MLKLEQVYTDIGELHIIHNVSLNIQKGEFVTLLGSNGAGKTTLFRTIAGVLKPAFGTVEFNGIEIDKLPVHKIVDLGIVLCPQGRQLFPELSVKKNLVMGAFSLRGQKSKIKKNLDRVYEHFPILKERSNQLAGTFSGGEQQMLAIGRALMSEPSMLLLDEPSMGLAPLIVKQIADVISNINHEMDTTIFLSEQNANMALNITERGYVLESGKCVLEGLCKDLKNDENVKRAYIGA